jgi:hypothetical protein
LVSRYRETLRLSLRLRGRPVDPRHDRRAGVPASDQPAERPPAERRQTLD